ncbi:hypothetical protein [Microbispora bryophytorum]|uniref:hypothetical protein n=1 Tax=Microbispora bryophytorum TaxID=1460882 RepID=UPI0033C96C69
MSNDAKAISCAEASSSSQCVMPEAVVILARVQAAVVAGATGFAAMRRFRHCRRRTDAAVRGGHAGDVTLALTGRSGHSDR